MTSIICYYNGVNLQIYILKTILIIIHQEKPRKLVLTKREYNEC